ncbi:hypothetical protein [Wenyingzhuangia sp. IMCC45467]
MKKIILSIAILASGVSTYAMTNNVASATVVSAVLNEGFTEVAVDKLPEAVTNAVKKDYPNATIDKAYVNDKAQYKLEISADDAASTVYIDKDGNWLEVK